MSRIVTLSDLHVRHGSTLPETMVALTWVLDDIRSREPETWPDLIILAGDLFDTAATAEALLALCGFVQDAATICEVVVLYGNHERARELDVLARLSAKHPITVYAKPSVHRVDGIALPLVPWIDRVLPITALAGYSVEQEKIAEEKRLLEILDGLRAELDAVAQPGDARVFAGHLMLAEAIGALNNPGQPDPKGKEFLVGLDQLQRLGCQIYALGHVHDGREWTVPGRTPSDAAAPVYYNGSTRSWGWGEILGKRYVEIEVTGDTAIPARLTYHAIPGRPMIQLDDAWIAGDDPGQPWGWKNWTGVDGELDDGEAKGALIRYSYEVPASRAEEARAAAEAVEKALYAAGAHHVKPSPQVQPEQRPRRPEMAAAKTLEDKLDVFATSRGFDPASDVVTRARRRLGGLRQDAGVAGRLATGGSRLRSIEASGMRAFHEAVSLDIDALPGPLVAIVGKCGSGKSTLLSCWAGVMHRSQEDDDIRELAEHTGGEISGGVVRNRIDVDGETWRLEHQLARGKSFAVCETAERDMVSGFKPFKLWAADNLLPREVMDAGPFGGQGQKGLLGFTPTARRDPLLKALGLGPLKVLHGLALAKVKEAAKIANAARGVLEAARAVKVPDVPAMVDLGAVERAGLEVIRLEAEVLRLDAEERRARAAAETLSIAVNADRATRRALDDERARCASALRGLEEQLAEHDDVLARADIIRAAVAVAVPLRASIVGGPINAIQAGRNADVEAAERLLSSGRAALAAIDARVRSASQRKTDHAEHPGYVERVEYNAALVAPRKAAVDAALAAVDVATQKLDDYRRRSQETLTGRVDGLRGGLEAVSTSKQIADAHGWAFDALDCDNAKVVDPARLVALIADVDEARDVLMKARRDFAAIEPCAGKVDDVRRRVAVAEGAAVDEAAALVEADGARAALAWLTRQHELAAQALADFLHWRGLSLAECGRVEVIARDAGKLARAEASTDTLAAPIAARRDELEQIDQRIADLPPAPTAPEGPTAAVLFALMTTAQTEASAARATIRAADETAARRSVAEEAADAARRAVAAAEAALVEPAAEEAALDLLVAFLGPRGLQTIEIDTACPELSAILRELLGCYGRRWAMTCEAMRPTSKGDGDVMEIRFPVIDSESTDSHPRDASRFSGGEAVVLAFAIRLAVTTLVTMRTSTILPTIVLDEPTAGLHDVADYEAVMAMVRRAAAMIGAGKVLVVSHTREVVELCDSAVHVANGKLDVISPARIPDAA